MKELPGWFLWTIPVGTIVIGGILILSGEAVFREEKPARAYNSPETEEATVSATTSNPILEEVVEKIHDIGAAMETNVSTPEPSPEKKVAPASPIEKKVAADGMVASSIATKARGAVVNVLCDSTYPVSVSTSGSGVIIDPRGIIVTNAHVAFYHLYTDSIDFNVECIVRTGNPATPAYKAKLMFISPQWIARYGITVLRPYIFSGVNGDFDYAFLYITGSATDKSLPHTFPYLPLSDSESYVGEPVIVVAYPSEFLTFEQTVETLTQTLTNATVKSTENFFGSDVDVIDLGGNAAAQQGSSGGAIVNSDGKLEAIATLGSSEESTENRQFRSITTTYLNRVYMKEEGKSLSTLFADPGASVRAFAKRIEKIRETLSY